MWGTVMQLPHPTHHPVRCGIITFKQQLQPLPIALQFSMSIELALG